MEVGICHRRLGKKYKKEMLCFDVFTYVLIYILFIYMIESFLIRKKIIIK